MNFFLQSLLIGTTLLVGLVSGQQQDLEWYLPLNTTWQASNWIFKGDNSTIFCCPDGDDAVWVEAEGSFTITVGEPAAALNISLGRNENSNLMATLELRGGTTLSVSQQLLIQPRGSLSGVGRIASPLVVNRGFIVDPDQTGSSTRLTLGGHLVHSAGAFMTAVLQTVDQFTQLTVEGTATLEGSLLIVMPSSLEITEDITLPILRFQNYTTGNLWAVQVFDAQLSNPLECQVTHEFTDTTFQVTFSGCSDPPESGSLNQTEQIVIIVLAAVAGVALIIVTVLIVLKVKRGYIC